MPATNVVPFVKGDKRIKDAEAAMTVIRTELYKHDLREMANYIGVSASCLFAIRRGSTKWPRHGTFFALIDALELNMYLVPR